MKKCFNILQASSKKQHHLNRHLYRPSTFLTSYEPPVFMDEDDERSAYYSGVQDPSADESVNLWVFFFFFYFLCQDMLPCV